MACNQETFVASEPIDDHRGEPTGHHRVMALCNGNIREDCGWSKHLTEHDDHTNDWWITSGEMADLHAEHMAASARQAEVLPLG